MKKDEEQQLLDIKKKIQDLSALADYVPFDEFVEDKIAVLEDIIGEE